MSAGAIAGTAVSIATDIFNGNDKDPERLNRNATWYTQAVAGDAVALCLLKHMSRRFGAGTCGGDSASGWATQKAADDAYSKYNAALAVLQSSGKLRTMNPVPSGVMHGVSDGSLTTGDFAQAGGLGELAKSPLGMLLLVGIAVAFLTMQKK